MCGLSSAASFLWVCGLISVLFYFSFFFKFIFVSFFFVSLFFAVFCQLYLGFFLFRRVRKTFSCNFVLKGRHE